MSAGAGLDHVVVNALFDLAGAAETFAALGFALTPLGRHSLGSINRLMMTETAYLEIVGVPAEGKQRQEVLDSPRGLNGLVFRTDDADATFDRLTAAGLEPSAPTAFSRPVEIGAETREARFRTVRVPAERFPAGRVYFCEHLTPELVWRAEWLTHPNGFQNIDRLTVGSTDVAADAALYAAAAGVAPPQGEEIAIDGFTIETTPADAARFLSLGLAFDGLDRVEAAATATDGVMWRRRDERAAVLTIPALDLHLECRSA